LVYKSLKFHAHPLIHVKAIRKAIKLGRNIRANRILVMGKSVEASGQSKSFQSLDLPSSEIETGSFTALGVLCAFL
jgi:hypothetical protein